MANRSFVIREVGSEDRKRFAVVAHGEAFEGKWKRKCLWVSGWYEKEDDARADAHRTNYPDYD
jgi:hypothetical protein